MGVYDLLIIGSGPGGLTAALYAGRGGLKTVVFEEGTLGGAIVNTALVENFPSYASGISGADLGSNLVSQVMQYEVEFKLSSVTGMNLRKDELKEVQTTEGDYLAKVVLLAGGAKPKRLGVPGADQFEGKGLSYCAYCDGNRFENKEVAVIGGGDSGVTEALYMTRISPKVTIIEILPKLNASMVLQQKAQADSRIEILCSNKVEGITADGDLRSVRLKNVETGEIRDLEVSGIFVHIGLVPETQFLKDAVKLDNLGYILVDQNMRTNIPGVFAVGDIRAGKHPHHIIRPHQIVL